MLKRKIYNSMKKWKEKDASRTALMIEGARRVGKSYIAEEFGKAEYRSYLLIDFARVGNDIREIFEQELSHLDTFFLLLSEYFGVKLYEHESLIIFDEVQRFPRAREAIKFLVADGRYHYIETGSLISIRSNTKKIQIPSEERHLKMFPMDFEEFLWAMGEDRLMDVITSRFEDNAPMGQALHRKALLLFRQYMIVGGMPQAVDIYIKENDFEVVDGIKRDILNLYREDIVKHAGKDSIRVQSVFDEIPSALSGHDTQFRLSALSKGARYREYEDAFFWLQDAMICNLCFNTKDPAFGLKLNRDRVTLKCYLGDTGLLISHSFDEKGLTEEEVYKRIMIGKLEANLGMIMENIVAQMLTATGRSLYYYKNSDRESASDRMEIDFLIAKSQISNRHNIVPIEVKSGSRYTLSSIQKFQKKYREQGDTPIVLHIKDYEEKNEMRFLPLYMTGLL